MDIRTLADRLVKVTLTGRLDASAVDRIETRLVASVVPVAHNTIIDFSRVEFVASMGIRMLLTIARSLNMKQARLALYGAPAGVNLVFETVALSRIIPVCTTEADALTAVGAGSA
jgi:anti-anti-sigma factor